MFVFDDAPLPPPATTAAASRSTASVVKPLQLASIDGVHPVASWALAFAPAESNNEQASACPASAAICRADRPPTASVELM